MLDVTGTLDEIQSIVQRHTCDLRSLAGLLHDAGPAIDNIQVALKKDWEAAEAMTGNLDDLAEVVGDAREATEILDSKLLKVHELVRLSRVTGK